MGVAALGGTLMARPLLNEEKYAWRWLRRELTRELGVNFHLGGRPRALTPLIEREIAICITSAPPKCRQSTYLNLADLHRVSVQTIQRIAMEVLWFRSDNA